MAGRKKRGRTLCTHHSWFEPQTMRKPLPLLELVLFQERKPTPGIRADFGVKPRGCRERQICDWHPSYAARHEFQCCGLDLMPLLPLSLASRVISWSLAAMPPRQIDGPSRGGPPTGGRIDKGTAREASVSCPPSHRSWAAVAQSRKKSIRGLLHSVPPHLFKIGPSPFGRKRPETCGLHWPAPLGVGQHQRIHRGILE